MYLKPKNLKSYSLGQQVWNQHLIEGLVRSIILQKTAVY